MHLKSDPGTVKRILKRVQNLLIVFVLIKAAIIVRSKKKF